jgi:hypothetical protein
MIIEISLSTDPISLGELVLASIDHLDQKKPKDMEWKEVKCFNLKIGSLEKNKAPDFLADAEELDPGY